jgi:tetratricopeptide (TPR) repeat protein
MTVKYHSSRGRNLVIWVAIFAMLALVWWYRPVDQNGDEVEGQTDLEFTGPEGGRVAVSDPVEDGEVGTQPQSDSTAKSNALLQRHNKKGLKAMRGKDYAMAAEQFRAALDLDPTHETLQLNLARALTRLGQTEIKLGKAQQALAHLEEAVAINLDAGNSESALAQAWMSLGQRQRAAELVAEVLQLHPKCKLALKVQAEIAFMEGELNLAVSSLQLASDLQPDDVVLANRLKFFKSEQDILTNFLRVRSTRFDCMYDATNPAIQPYLQQLLLDLEEASDAVNQVLGLQPSDRLLVLLLSPKDYVAGAPNWSNGLYDGRIRVPFDGSRAPGDNLRATFRHEYTHAALHRVGPSLPTWLHEGIAQFVEGKDWQRSRSFLQNNPSHMPTLTQLQGNWTEMTDSNRVQAAYAYSLSFHYWFVEQFGNDALATLVQAVSTQGPIDAFQFSFGESVESLDQRHRALVLAN